MIDRRSFLTAAAAGAALLTPYRGFAQSAGPIRFGVMADPQYADQRNKGSRHYRRTLEKLPPALETLNQQPDLDFVVTLGDIIDKDWQSYLTLLPLYQASRHDHFFLLGNHDYQVAPEYLDQVHKITGITRTNYTFAGPGHRFIVLDGNEISILRNRPGTENYEEALRRMSSMKSRGLTHGLKRNGSITDAQFDWLEAELNAARAAGERVIAMSHYPIYPANDYNLWEDTRLVDMLTSYDNFVLYICGHNHRGNYGQIGRAHFVNFKGMVETRRQTAFATAAIHDDRIEITGFGKEESRLLRI